MRKFIVYANLMLIPVLIAASFFFLLSIGNLFRWNTSQHDPGSYAADEAGSLTVEAEHAETKPDKRTIVIDPGHGGQMKGTYGRVSGILEKDLNLHVSLQLAEALNDRGYDTVLTRTTDTEVYVPPVGETYDNEKDLQARVEIAARYQAELFLSIHADNFPQDPGVNGTGTYYSSKNREPVDSKKFAEILLERAVSALETRPFGVEDRDFYVLRENIAPAVLLEMGFLSNPHDESRLIDPEAQIRLVEAIVQSIEEYFEWKVDSRR